MLKEWLDIRIPHLVRLASLPFDRTAHEDFFANVGWTVFREDWYPETCIEIHFDDVGRRLVAVYDEKQPGLGIGLYVVSGSPSVDDFYLSTLAEYNDVIQATLTQVEPHVPRDAIRGDYDCQYSDHQFQYAYWPFAETFLALVQHFEGDGQAGHECSLDLRIVPRTGADQLTFPLTTNILF